MEELLIADEPEVLWAWAAPAATNDVSAAAITKESVDVLYILNPEKGVLSFNEDVTFRCVSPHRKRSFDCMQDTVSTL